MNNFNKQFWEQRWTQGQTGWDAGGITDPFSSFFATLNDKKAKILIPGGGNGYEASWLWEKGFENVHLLDIVEQPLRNFKARHPDFPGTQLICGDFFAITQKFDLVIEQTFFCALDPSLRQDYARKMADILPSGGRLAGLLFCFPLTEEGPPFGGSLQEYRNLFSTSFEITHLEPCVNSIKPRSGKELWVELIRK